MQIPTYVCPDCKATMKPIIGHINWYCSRCGERLPPPFPLPQYRLDVPTSEADDHSCDEPLEQR